MCLEDIDVLILCGGHGTRIRKTLGDIPKVLAPINGRPYLDYLIAKLKHARARRAILCVGNLAQKIVDWRDTKKVLDSIEILCSFEKSPLGTAGAVVNAMKMDLSDPVLIINGDTLSTIDLCAMMELYEGTPLTVQTYIYESGGEMEYAGHYVMPKKMISATAPFKDIAVYFSYLQERGKAWTLRMQSACYLDIGSPDDYAKAGKFVKEFGIDYQ